MRRFGFTNRSTSTGKVVTAALVGSVVGAAVGLLMAPTSGQELRRRIKDEVTGTGDPYEKAQTAIRDGGNRARQLAAQHRTM